MFNTFLNDEFGDLNNKVKKEKSFTEEEIYNIRNQFMIGNIIEQGTIIEIRENNVRVSYISDKPRTSLISYENIKPIKLTTELYKQYGFDVNIFNDNEGFKVFEITRKDFDLDCIYYYETTSHNGFHFNCWENSKAPQHLHQLQNIFYNLTLKKLVKSK